jgi:GH25 family lysozyme M1 (1,4-beta-N-acetylmuramidase)
MMPTRFSSFIRLSMMTILTACVPPGDEGSVMQAGEVPDVETDSKALVRKCSDGATVRGVDVSYYQSTIDWDQVRGAGIQFAFIRVSDGLRHIDSQFNRNWSEARRVGIRRGAYQFFRPELDPIAQANLLLQRMGTLQPGDLPPVIDVEAAGGLSARNVAQKAKQWIDHVRAATGVTPIIYTGPYFWRDSVGSPSYSTDHLLWLAHYTTACPLIPEPWSRWSFHQYTDSGRVAGIRGNVDMNLFNGSLADLDAVALSGQPPPPPAPCDKVGANGGIMEEDDACVELGGPTRYLRSEGTGHGGSHVWTGATASSRTVNFASYKLVFDAAGAYEIDAFVGGGTSIQTRYSVTHAGGTAEVSVSQSGNAAFARLGTFNFAANVEYSVLVVDNTGESPSLDRRIVFDALRVTPSAPNPMDPNLCLPIPVSGGVLEEDGACVELGGPAQFLRAESTGHDGGHVWTGATASQQAQNFARWALSFDQAGLYRIEAHVAAGGRSNARGARYRITHAGGSEEVFADQSTAAGFIDLGTFQFAAGGGYAVRLDDNTGEGSSLARRVVFDAIQATPVTAMPCAEIAVAAGVGALNVRSRPNTDLQAIAQLASNQVVDRLATVSGLTVEGDAKWHRIRWGQTVGYVSARYSVCAP